MLDKPIMPTFMSVYDDPTLKEFNGESLSGHYVYDDEGQAARRVDLVKDGVLETFLMSRLPIASFFEQQWAWAGGDRAHADGAAGEFDCDVFKECFGCRAAGDVEG